MQVTKFLHACLLVELSDGRTALFDPGVFSEPVFDLDKLDRLDDIIITHIHGDHFHMPFVQKLAAKFPDVRITATPEIVEQLTAAGIKATDQPSADITFFTAPHELVAPFAEQPQNIGVHYADLVSHPGDSHSFTETKAVLALPLAGPWANMVHGVNLALQLKPQYVLPIHDWHLSDQARKGIYGNLVDVFKEQGIAFVPLETGEPQAIDL